MESAGQGCASQKALSADTDEARTSEGITGQGGEGNRLTARHGTTGRFRRWISVSWVAWQHLRHVRGLNRSFSAEPLDQVLIAVGVVGGVGHRDSQGGAGEEDGQCLPPGARMPRGIVAKMNVLVNEVARLLGLAVVVQEELGGKEYLLLRHAWRGVGGEVRRSGGWVGLEQDGRPLHPSSHLLQRRSYEPGVGRRLGRIGVP